MFLYRLRCISSLNLDAKPLPRGDSRARAVTQRSSRDAGEEELVPARGLFWRRNLSSFTSFLRLKMLTELFILSLSLLAATGEGDKNAEGKHWGLIVAGSNSWFNYRHQVRAV